MNLKCPMIDSKNFFALTNGFTSLKYFSSCRFNDGITSALFSGNSFSIILDTDITMRMNHCIVSFQDITQIQQRNLPCFKVAGNK